MKVRLHLMDNYGSIRSVVVSAPCAPRIGEDVEIEGTHHGQVRSVVWVVRDAADPELEAVVTVR